MFRWRYVKNLIQYKLHAIFKLPVDLKNNKSFCILPWVHMYIQPDGNCYPCCISNNTNTPFGSLKNQTLKEVWNSDIIKQFRLDLLNGKMRPDFCSTCYKKENFKNKSERLEFNKVFFHLIKPSLHSMTSGGHVNEMNWSYWDFRLSNKCNFRCRTCGPTFSTSWQAEVAHFEDTHASNFKPIWQQGFEFFKENAQNIEQIYFAGGEPLIIDEHYQLLEWLLQNNKTDVVLSYNTNLSELTYKNWNALDLWKKFKHVYISPSLDHYGPQAEYVRKGTHWKNLLQNLEKIKSQKNITLSPTITISLLNILNFTEIHNYYLNAGIIKNVNDFAANILKTPNFYNISTLPEHLKQIVKKDLALYNQQLLKTKGKTLSCTEEILTELKVDNSHLMSQFLTRTRELDKIRNENYQLFYPDFK